MDPKKIEECQRKVGMASLKLRTRRLLKMPFRLKYRTDTWRLLPTHYNESVTLINACFVRKCRSLALLQYKQNVAEYKTSHNTWKLLMKKVSWSSQTVAIVFDRKWLKNENYPYLLHIPDSIFHLPQIWTKFVFFLTNLDSSFINFDFALLQSRGSNPHNSNTTQKLTSTISSRIAISCDLELEKIADTSSRGLPVNFL